jgi:two-component system phosphate regulon response regulator PhoB
MPSPRVLIVEDDPELAEMLAQSLQRAGLDARTTSTAFGALHEARTWRPDVVVLDLVLPDGSGKDVCRALKAEPATQRIQVIIASALGGEIDRVVGFELGADDYVPKPYSVRELVLRVRAQLRRREAPAPPPTAPVTLGRLLIDGPAKRVWVDDEPVSLTDRELALLVLLSERREQVVTREALTRAVWGDAVAADGRAVDTLVVRLRLKLRSARGHLHTVRGVGYRLSQESEG